MIQQFHYLSSSRSMFSRIYTKTSFVISSPSWQLAPVYGWSSCQTAPWNGFYSLTRRKKNNNNTYKKKAKHPNLFHKTVIRAKREKTTFKKKAKLPATMCWPSNDTRSAYVSARLYPPHCAFLYIFSSR